jgi:Ca2+-binding EF-hand superfamily protein
MDGTLTTAELEKAASALKQLDKDGDGKITREEARPEFDRGSFGGRDGDRGGFGNFSPEDFAARMLERSDANKDGELTAEELGDRGARMLESGDANKDGKLDTDELLKVAQDMQARFGNRDGRPGGRPDRDNDGDRPQRPAQDGDRPATPPGDNN